MRFQRIIVTLVAAAMFVAAGYFAWQYFKLSRENAELRRINAQRKRDHASESEKLNESMRVLKRLREDPEFAEMIIRRRLGYARDGELIFNFETPAEATVFPLFNSDTLNSVRSPQ